MLQRIGKATANMVSGHPRSASESAVPMPAPQLSMDSRTDWKSDDGPRQATYTVFILSQGEVWILPLWKISQCRCSVLCPSHAFREEVWIPHRLIRTLFGAVWLL